MKIRIPLLIRIASCVLATFGIAPRSNGQLVFVPDINLRAALNAWVPGAVDASGNLDLSNPAVVAQSSLGLNIEWSPADLTGIDALEDLTSLVLHGRCYSVWSDSYGPCDSAQISIPAWPSNLLALQLDRGTWANLPPFPASLTTLSINVMGLSVIPPLPDGLTALSLTDKTSLNALPDLPSGLLRLYLASAGHAIPALPTGLTYLNIQGVPGITIPNLPSALDTIYLASFNDTAVQAWPTGIRFIQLTNMAHLVHVADWPLGLEHVDIRSTPSLAQVPAWPASLITLRIIDADALASLPPFPPGVEQIQLVSYGLDSIAPALTLLPPWPNGIQSIFLAAMPFTELPPFPAGLQVLDINYLHELTCLPVLPQGLNFLRVDIDDLGLPPTGINCFPNYPPNATIQWGFDLVSDPDLLCTALNSNCDFLNPVATGAAFQDQNANGVRDPGEPGYPFVTLHQLPGNGMHGVAADGTYAWPMPMGNYTLSAQAANPYVVSIAPAQYTLALDTAGEVSTSNDFAVILQPDVADLRIDLNGPWGQPGFDSYGTITCGNVGTMPMDATVTFQLDPIQEWIGGTPAPTTVSGNTITWNMAALQVGEVRHISLTVHTDAGIALCTPLQHWAQIGPVAGDANPADNTSTDTSSVVGSFDPNDKQVRPAALSPDAVAGGQQELTYTVRFQNTGTWPAVKVRVVDTLSQDLQWPTFRMISSSHPCTWELSSTGVLTFLFDPIQLPDSLSNEPGSHGSVRFAIKPATGLAGGATVANRADIYFDFNAPVTTEASIFTVEEGASIAETTQELISVHPNPVRDKLWVQSTGMLRHAEVFDALGRSVLQQDLPAGTGNSIAVDRLVPGVYHLRCTWAEGVGTVTFIKQ